MQLADIYAQFARCKFWEERYRLLIQLSRRLPVPSADELAQWQQIHGCESRLWFEFSLTPRQIHAYSDARLMQGLLVIILAALTEQTAAQLQQFDLHALFDELQITRHLTATRLNGLAQIQAKVRAEALSR
ncbi:hypothetical protein RO21_05695 [[Actinobacillus] muris]|uniref:Fe-S metabolism associated domain-containing protein n=1 Tax=Muribacter muris TaxID=67855 RepID=A0A0J5S445_9PAST|nr:SufE family protein [Muribacter muris]KMK51557.1 hypothetical protein RO21_05695 [[Actinobacillus] muris] [Muribacter muris]